MELALLEEEELAKSTEKALARANEIITSALNSITPKFQERQGYLDMYHSYDQALKLKQLWQTKFAHPFPFFSTEMKASFFYEGVFGTNSQGLWEVAPWDEESYESARVTSKLLKYQEDNSDFVKTFYLGAKGLSITGDWFLETYWDSQEREIQLPTRFEMSIDEMSRTPSVQSVRGPRQIVVDKAQPDARTLLVNSIWPDPKAMSLNDARYICVRREYTLSYLKEKEKQGRYIDVSKIKGTTMPKMPNAYYDLMLQGGIYQAGNSQIVTGSSPIDSEDPLVEVVEIWYPKTGEVESIANRAVYLGRRQAYANLNNPFVHIKNFEENGKFFGASDYRPIRGHWDIINKMQCLEVDNTLFHYRGYTKVARDAGPNVIESFENLRPGSVITMNNLGAVAHERPDLMSQYTSQIRAQLVTEAMQPMGMNEILAGATPSSNVRSSSQFSQLANFGAKMMSQGIRGVSQGLKELGVKWLKLNYEFLDPNTTFPVLGPDGAKIIRIEPGQIPVTANVSVRLSADLEAEKAQRLQQQMQLMGVTQTVPGFASQKYAKEIFRTSGATVADPDSMFLLTDEQSAAIALSQFGLGPNGQSMGGPKQSPSVAGSTQVAQPAQVAGGNMTSGRPEVPQV